MMRSIRRVLPACLCLLVSAPVPGADTGEALFDLEDLRVKIDESVPYVETRHEGQKVLIMRHQDPGHTLESPYAKTSRDCPPFCVQPMTLAPGVETIAELELVDYLKRIGEGDEGVMVIDSRTGDWVANGTIPGSVNIPYTRLDPAYASTKDLADLLELELGAIRVGDLWSFGAAKTLVFFCNGAWCGQSSTNIRALLDLGYPPHKLKWYRGGMQSWEQLGFTTVKGEGADG
jgi:rhodanese-related sulfurtransferase